MFTAACALRVGELKNLGWGFVLIAPHREKRGLQNVNHGNTFGKRGSWLGVVTNTYGNPKYVLSGHGSVPQKQGIMPLEVNSISKDMIGDKYQTL